MKSNDIVEIDNLEELIVLDKSYKKYMEEI